jgi:hypothetical protein
MFMDFTLLFIRVFALDLVHVAPVLAFFILTICIIVYMTGKLEGWLRFDALYYAFMTATTVGYGDFSPTRKSTKILAVVLAFIGIIFTGIIVAIALPAAGYAFEEVYQNSAFLRR